MNPGLPADLAAAVALGGEMGRRFAEFDWAAHPLGPPQDWPAEMRTAVTVALTSRFPIVLWSGHAQDLFMVYNDAYIPILATSIRRRWAGAPRGVVGHLGIDRPHARQCHRHR